MNNQLVYRIIARFYDVLDHTYFRNKVRSPRTAVMKFIEESDQTVLDICTGTGANALEIARCREMSRYMELICLRICCIWPMKREVENDYITLNSKKWMPLIWSLRMKLLMWHYYL